MEYKVGKNQKGAGGAFRKGTVNQDSMSQLMGEEGTIS
jgi:hypothetical protein